MHSDVVREAERVLEGVLSSERLPCYNSMMQERTVAGLVVGKYTKSVNIRLEKDDYEELQRRADRRGMPLSIFLRSRIKLDIIEKPDTEPTEK